MTSDLKVCKLLAQTLPLPHFALWGDLWGLPAYMERYGVAACLE